MRKRAKVDLTHGPIVEAFRAGGWQVLSLAPLGNGAPDLLVYAPAEPLEELNERWFLIEVKTGKKALKPGQCEFAKNWPVHVLRSVQEAVEFMASH